MKHQALFSSKDKSKEICNVSYNFNILFGVCRVKMSYAKRNSHTLSE